MIEATRSSDLHSHGKRQWRRVVWSAEEHHAEAPPDPTFWLSPSLVKVQSQAIYEALVELDPDHEAAYKANLEAFIADIDALEADVRETLSGLESKKFIVFHPSWGYFARDSWPGADCH